MPRVYHRYKNPPKGAKYIGRPSPYGNPFTVEEFGRGEAVGRFAEWFPKQLGLVERAKKELKGQDLVCFCAPEGGLTCDDPLVCHGQIVMRYANE